VTGYRISTTDGALGHVEDFIVDDVDWSIRYLVVETAPLWFGKKVLVAPEWVSHFDWMKRQVEAGFAEQDITAAPEWDGTLPLDPDYDRALFLHYGRTTLVIWPRCSINPI
jgi:hypothetical protein